jgi:hypothetical protein
MIKVQGSTDVDYIAKLLEELTDRELVLNGRFTQAIADFNAARAEAEKKLGMVDTVAKADKIRADADAYGAATRKAADAALAKANDALGAANAKMDAALTKEKSVASREAQALAVMSDYEERAKTFDDACAKREAALATREAALSAGQAKLSADAANLAAKQRSVIEQLDAAKALAKAI